MIDIKQVGLTEDEKKVQLEKLKHIFTWLFNILYDKIVTFPFYYRISDDTQHWYNIICILIFGPIISNYSKKQQKAISVTSSESDDEDSMEYSVNRIKFEISKILEKTK